MTRKIEVLESAGVRALLAHLDERELYPKFTLISKRSGVPVSTLHDAWRKLRERGKIRVTVEFLLPTHAEEWLRLGETITVWRTCDKLTKELRCAGYPDDRPAICKRLGPGDLRPEGVLVTPNCLFKLKSEIQEG